MDIKKTGEHFMPQAARQGSIAKQKNSFENVFGRNAMSPS